MKSILDPKFRYVPSSRTNIRKTFQRIRDETKKKKQAQVVTLKQVVK